MLIMLLRIGSIPGDPSFIVNATKHLRIRRRAANARDVEARGSGSKGTRPC